MEEVRLTLYLDLEQGQYADLKIASRAGMAFASAIEEIVGHLDPDATASVEVISGTEGSYGLNTLTRITVAATKVQRRIQHALETRPVAKWLVVYVVFRIVNNGIDWTQDRVMDWLAGDQAPAVVQTMSEEDRRALAADIVALVRKDVAGSEVRTIYREAERDTKIDGVGVAMRPKEKPAVIVPRSEFHRFTGNAPAPDGDTRVQTTRMQVTLISPVLVEGDRRWKFRASTGEFGAPVKDRVFLDQLLGGQTNIRLRGGLELDIELETHEVRRDGVWNIESRDVTKVHGWTNAPVQEELLSAPAYNVKPAEEQHQHATRGD